MGSNIPILQYLTKDKSCSVKITCGIRDTAISGTSAPQLMCHSAWDFKVQPLPPFFHPVAERKLYCLLVWGFTFLFITLPFICGFLSQLLLKRILKGEVKLRPTFINRENEALCFNAPVYFLLILMEDAYTHAKESVLPRNFPS